RAIRPRDPSEVLGLSRRAVVPDLPRLVVALARHQRVRRLMCKAEIMTGRDGAQLWSGTTRRCKASSRRHGPQTGLVPPAKPVRIFVAHSERESGHVISTTYGRESAEVAETGRRPPPARPRIARRRNDSTDSRAPGTDLRAAPPGRIFERRVRYARPDGRWAR